MLKQCQHKIQISSVSQQSSYLLAFMGCFSIFMLEAAKLFAVSWILKHIKKNGRRCNRNSRIPSSQRIIIGIKEEQFKQITMKHSNTTSLAEYLTRDSYKRTQLYVCLGQERWSGEISAVEGVSTCGELILSRFQVSTKPLYHSCSSAGQGEENMTKGSSDEIEGDHSAITTTDKKDFTWGN